MSNPNNPSNIPDYRAAAQWANNYLKNNNSKKDDGINIFWIVIVLFLLALAVWWWWTTYKSKPKESKINTFNGKETVANMSPLDEMRASVQKSSRFIIKPDGSVLKQN